MLLSEEIKLVMARSVLCWMASCSPDLEPNVSPKEIFTHYGDDQILIANIASPGTLRNLKKNPKVSLSFIDIFVQKGFQIKGVAAIIEKGDPRFEELAQPLIKLTGGLFPFGSIFKIEAKSSKQILAPRYILFPETTEADQIERAKTQYGL